MNLFMPRLFWVHFGGATSTRGGISIDALMAAQEQDFGACMVHEPSDLLNARNIVIWGRNPAVTNVHLMPIIKKARAQGAELTVIDPRRTETAALADRHIAPPPGQRRSVGHRGCPGDQTPSGRDAGLHRSGLKRLAGLFRAFGRL